jgi:hypothetical protein
MTTQEYIQLKKEILYAYNKQAVRYNKLASAYLEKYKNQRERCNNLIREIDNLENKLVQELKTV